MSKDKAKRCALYIRVSTDRQVDGNSLTTQKKQLMRHARSRGYPVADVYVDAGLSGKDMNRPELQRLLSDAREGRFDIVLVWKVDRISRSMKDLLSLLKTLREHNVDFAAVDQDFDTSDPAGNFTLNMLGGFAQFERELLVERTKEGHLRRLLKRDWSCGPVPVGYRKVGGKLVEHPKEAKLVRRIFDLFLKLKTRRGVAGRLNGEGVMTPKGKAWTGGRITAILKNPVYTGANAYGRHKKNGQRKPASEWTVVPGMREPIVTQEKFDAVQALMKEIRIARKKCQPNQVYSLTGLVRCGKCGGPMCGTALRRNGRLYQYYRCNTLQHRGRLVRADLLEKAVMGKVRGLAQDRAAAQTPTQDEPQRETDERKETRRALDRLRERTARLFDLYELGQLDKALFQERMALLSENRDRLVTSLKARPGRNADEGDLPRVGAASSGIERVVVRDRSADVHVAGGATAEVSLLPDCDTTTFGGRLKAWRLRDGLMQRDMARMLDVDVCSVRNWEAGRCTPRQAVQERLRSRLQSCGGGA